MSALRSVEAERGPGRPWVLPDPPARERIRLARVLPATVWLAAAVTGAALGERPGVGLLLVVAVVVGEWLASRDDYGSKALSGGIGMLAVLLVGWPVGVVIALGAVAFGDVLLRDTEARRALWWTVLLAIMLSAGAWAVGVRGTMPTPTAIPMAIAAASFVIFGVWMIHRLATGRLREAAAGTVILGIIGAALLGPLWMPGLPQAAQPWVGAGMTGMGLAAAFMLTDMAIASAVAWRAGGLRALAFWPQHMPVLFARYAGQGIAAGLAAYVFTLGGALVLLVLLAVAFCGQWLHQLYRETRALLDSTVGALAAAVDARDAYTAGHSARVADFGARVAVDLGWPKAMVERTRTAGLLHDVGKLGVSDGVLYKPGRLDPDEYAHIQGHPAIGQHIVSRVGGLRAVAELVGQHHERWDGAGYPRGLRGAEIAPEARLVSLADVYDALTTARPYRGPLPEAEVLAHIEAEAGQMFDPDLAHAFVRVIEDGRASGVFFCYCATH
jgi:hypothetical protein